MGSRTWGIGFELQMQSLAGWLAGGLDGWMERGGRGREKLYIEGVKWWLGG
jgi:hypothetical protein